MKESTSPRVQLRKKPTQARSIQKYNRILDVVAELVEAGGTEWVTTNLIAEKVGVPIGTIYQFFPNKESILYALFERQLNELDTHFEPFFSETLDQLSMEQLMGQAVFSMSTAYEKVPGMVNIMNSMHVHPDFRELVHLNNRRLAKWLLGLLKRRYPEQAEDRLMLVSEAVVELGDAIFRKLLQFRPRDELREMMLTGFKLSAVALAHEHLEC